MVVEWSGEQIKVQLAKPGKCKFRINLCITCQNLGSKFGFQNLGPCSSAWHHPYYMPRLHSTISQSALIIYVHRSFLWPFGEGVFWLFLDFIGLIFLPLVLFGSWRAEPRQQCQRCGVLQSPGPRVESAWICLEASEWRRSGFPKWLHLCGGWPWWCGMP